MQPAIGAATPGVPATRWHNRDFAVRLRVGSRGCIVETTRRPQLNVEVVVEARRHTSQLLRGFVVVCQCRRKCRLTDGGNEAIRLDNGADAKLPRLEDKVAPGAVFPVMPLYPVRLEMNALEFLVEDEQVRRVVNASPRRPRLRQRFLRCCAVVDLQLH